MKKLSYLVLILVLSFWVFSIIRFYTSDVWDNFDTQSTQSNSSFWPLNNQIDLLNIPVIQDKPTIISSFYIQSDQKIYIDNISIEIQNFYDYYDWIGAFQLLDGEKKLIKSMNLWKDARLANFDSLWLEIDGYEVYHLQAIPRPRNELNIDFPQYNYKNYYSNNWSSLSIWIWYASNEEWEQIYLNWDSWDVYQVSFSVKSENLFDISSHKTTLDGKYSATETLDVGKNILWVIRLEANDRNFLWGDDEYIKLINWWFGATYSEWIWYPPPPLYLVDAKKFNNNDLMLINTSVDRDKDIVLERWWTLELIMLTDVSSEQIEKWLSYYWFYLYKLFWKFQFHEDWFRIGLEVFDAYNLFPWKDGGDISRQYNIWSIKWWVWPIPRPALNQEDFIVDYNLKKWYEENIKKQEKYLDNNDFNQNILKPIDNTDKNNQKNTEKEWSTWSTQKNLDKKNLKYNINVGSGGWARYTKKRVVEYCGDGIVNGAEECDDWNYKKFDGCDNACKLEKIEADPESNKIEIEHWSAVQVDTNHTIIQQITQPAQEPGEVSKKLAWHILLLETSDIHSPQERLILLAIYQKIDTAYTTDTAIVGVLEKLHQKIESLSSSLLASKGIDKEAILLDISNFLRRTSM